MLFTRRKQSGATEQRVAEGATFRRRSQGPMDETARVIEVAPDPAGIPHVRFDLTIRNRQRVAHERRILSLSSFAALYTVPVAE